MTRKLFFITLAVCVFVSSSCNKKQQSSIELPQSDEAQVLEPENAVRLSHVSQETKDYLSGKHIILVLGYGYNDEQFVREITELMDLNYGMETEESEGLVTCFVYPDDFTRAGKIRVSSLTDLIADRTLAGIIIIGAPEGLNIPLAKMQDATESGKLDYPVFSFFSQDEVLAAEAASDFVVDYALKTDNMETEESSYVPDFDVQEMLLNAVQMMINVRAPLQADANLMPTVQKIIGNERIVKHYFDSETGLMSVNHFIFE